MMLLTLDRWGPAVDLDPAALTLNLNPRVLEAWLPPLTNGS